MTPLAVRSLAALVAATSVAVLLGGSAAAAPPPAARELAPGVHLLPGRFVPGTQPDGNSVVFSGPQGLVVVDTGRHAAHTESLLDFARQAGQPVAAVINTHWHLDHLGGNPRIRAAFPAVQVHASTALAGALGGFLADYRAYLVDALAKAGDDEATAAPLRAELAILDAGPALGPDVPVNESGTRTLAGRPLELHLATHAATAGDVWIFDPASRILVAGDLVTLPAPFLDTACPAGWRAALDEVAATDFALLVPGHGPAMDRATFTRYHAAFGGLLDCAAGDAAAATCIDGWLDGVGELIPEADRAFARDMVQYYLDQHLRGDPAKTAALCAQG